MKTTIILLTNKTKQKYIPNITNQDPIINTNPKNELTEVIENINEDKLDQTLRMSSIDLKSNLNKQLIRNITAFDTLTSIGVYPQKLLILTRQIKRLMVSDQALGRKNIVDMVGGQREHTENTTGFGPKIKNIFGLRK